ncbi:MAG: hypothetical protein Q7S66_01980 [bacterium]|nr:hypothetical protein [bacterium]
MLKKTRSILIWSIVALAVVAGISYAIYSSSQPGKLDEFAQCLEEKGAVFYGAFWCSHCQATKDLFGKSAKFLPYVECSTPDGRGQSLVCTQKNITGYPTWEFSDGNRLSGEVSLNTLVEKTGCKLP